MLTILRLRVSAGAFDDCGALLDGRFIASYVGKPINSAAVTTVGIGRLTSQSRREDIGMSLLCHLCPLTRANSATLRSWRDSRHAPAVEHWAGFGSEAPFQQPVSDAFERLRLANSRHTTAVPRMSAPAEYQSRTVTVC